MALHAILSQFHSSRERCSPEIDVKGGARSAYEREKKYIQTFKSGNLKRRGHLKIPDVGDRISMNLKEIVREVAD